MTIADQTLQDLVLRLPDSLRDRAEEMASRTCLSLNLFVLTAIAEKIQRMQLEECLQISERDDLPNPISAFSNLPV